MAKTQKNDTGSTMRATRRVELPKRRWDNPRTWRRNLPLPPRQELSSVRQLVKKTCSLLRANWRTFGGITIVYGIGVLIFVRSFSISSSSTATDLTATGGIAGKVGETFNQIAGLLSDANASLSAATGVYQVVISTICCLALIWAFRQVLSHEKAGVRQSFYQGMTPLVKYLLVLAMFGVQLIPMALGGYLMSVVVSSGIFFGWELWAAGFVFALLAIWSLWLVTHTMFATFITTLPDMTPVKSLRSAKKMVYRRRLLIWRKLLGALILGGILVVILMLPPVLWWPAAGPWVMYVISVAMVPVGQAFLYTLYREIL